MRKGARPRLPVVRSLVGRLVLSSLVTALVMLVLAGALLFWLFRSTVERQFDARLEALMNGLLAHLEQGEDGSFYLTRNPANPLFELPASGWYWQIAPLSGAKGAVLTSPSLLEKRFELRSFERLSRDEDGAARLTMRGPHGIRLRVLEQRISLFDDENRYSIVVAGNAERMERQVALFRRALVAISFVFALALAIIIAIQMRVAMRPLKLLHREIGEVRDGNRQRLEGEFPSELEPVVRELNQLIHANRAVIERARTQVGNLAHALKTPLAVLTNEADGRDDELARMVRGQVALMREQVSMYLERARRAAQAATLGMTTDVRPVIEALLNALRRIYHERGARVEVECPESARFRGERQDLEELLGNLLDNAFKYGGGHIRVRCVVENDGTGAWLRITVEDDGPGLSREERARALQRGQRLDETRPGSGLGLSIVKEMAEMYNGRLRLSRASLGGLRVEVWLPAVALETR